MKTEHGAVKKPRILQDIAGAEQADTAELGQKGTANEDGENNPQFGQDGDSLIDTLRLTRLSGIGNASYFATAQLVSGANPNPKSPDAKPHKGTVQSCAPPIVKPAPAIDSECPQTLTSIEKCRLHNKLSMHPFLHAQATAHQHTRAHDHGVRLAHERDKVKAERNAVQVVLSGFGQVRFGDFFEPRTAPGVQVNFRGR
ncbi:hypothetical protein C8J57DRAFT_1236175 [Mycena rebaudengoi]|nr:hypothetical protein C8J57DRAFT_1236175 [Mycena rebaudengoi]